MKIYYSPRFKKLYKKLSNELKKTAEEKEIIFRSNPFDTKLKIHKLHGDLSECWAFSINYSHRIILEFVNSETVWFLNIGGHDIYE